MEQNRKVYFIQFIKRTSKKTTPNTANFALVNCLMNDGLSTADSPWYKETAARITSFCALIIS